MRIFRMRPWMAALLLGWWFYAYPLDATTTTTSPPRLHGPYPTLWACLRGALDLEWTARYRLMASQCFPERE